MNIWHDMRQERITQKVLLRWLKFPKAAKEIRVGQRDRPLILDRILYTSTHYPANYGFIPRTFAKDRDPLDVLVLCSEELEPLSMVKCYPVGVIRMIDEEQEDHKIIAIPFEDPNWNYFHEMSELPPHLSQEVEHFFQVYKTLEHKETTGFEVLGRKEALRIIEESIVSYQEIFGDGQKNCK